MKNLHKLVLFIVLFALTLSACAAPTPESGKADLAKDVTGDTPRVQEITASEQDIKDVAEGNTTFALDLYRQLAANEGNLIFSPYSISQALAMTYAGASGATATEMANVLHFTLEVEKFHPAFNSLDLTLKQQTLQDGKAFFEFNVANALWGQHGYSFKPLFLNTVSANYGGGLKEVDFAQAENARATINRWVENQTNNKIKDLIPQNVLDESTRLVLTNAVYFKAPWAIQFDAANTHNAPFFKLDGTSIDVPMMKLRQSYNAADTDTYQAVEVPYKGFNYSMVIFMPKEDKFAEFEQTLDSGALAKYLNELQSGTVILSMPKFKVESSLGLKDSLIKLGMNVPFSSDADFSAMTGNKELLISDVLQKAFIDVNEEGTEAAAATSVIVGKTSLEMEEPLTITLDHPFIYLIKDRQTNSILFMGRVVLP